jgi:hypothetical protein
MNRITRRRLARVLCLGAVLSWLDVAQSADSPTAEEILTRVAERARQIKGQPPRYEFTRTKTTLEFGKKHEVQSREEQTYRMVVIGGELYPRLIAKDGKPLSADQLSKQRAEELKFKQKQRGHAAEGDSILALLEEKFAKRFAYAVTGRDTLDGRSAYVVSVSPKPGLPAKEILEKILARMAGRLWIDVEEAEVIQVELGLTKPVHIGLGVLGSVEAVQLHVRRDRLAEGGWINSKARLKLQFRILLDRTRLQYEESITEVAPVNPAGIPAS